MRKTPKILLGMLVMLMSVIFAQNARADEGAWFKDNFSLVNQVYMVHRTLFKPRLDIYRNNSSGNCYAIYSLGNNGGFSQVPCEDFLEDREKEKQEELRASVARHAEESPKTN